MKNNTVKILLVGDVFGPVGLRCMTTLLKDYIVSEKIDFTIVNGENATGGIGLSEPDAKLLLSAGADVITGGNHTFEKRDYWPVLENFPEVLRPANYPEAVGRGFTVCEKNGHRFAVLNLQGRDDMIPVDCPFRCADTILSALSPDDHPFVCVDFHAESNQEKEAMGLYLAGRASVVAGTHSHVQTADERILPGGTAYISDLGMTGPIRSVIGANPEFAIKRNITQVLYRMESQDTAGALRGLMVEVDAETRCAVSVCRVELKEKPKTTP